MNNLCKCGATGWACSIYFLFTPFSRPHAALIGGAQKVEHYEIASYGTIAALAKQLGYKDALPLLLETLQEEKATDEKLTILAKSGGNQRAAAA